MTTVKADWDVQNSEGQYAVYCPCCERWRWLSKRSAWQAVYKQSICFLCSQAKKAKLGFAAMVRIYGWRWAIRHVRDSQLENPQPTAVAVAQMLNEIGVEYVPEYQLATKARGRRKWVCLIDFMVVCRGMMWAIEVNGGVHKLPHKIKNDKRKARLLKRRAIPLLVLSTEQVESGAFITLILQFLSVQEYEAYGIPTVR
jgi:hypothetical protein